MSSTTPSAPIPSSHTRARSTSRTRPHHPITPLRPPSRGSLRASTTSGNLPQPSPLDTLEPSFAELSDSLSDLEANLLHLQLLSESVSRFNENFSAFLHGLNMSAFCVDFPEAPGTESYRRFAEREQTRAKEEEGRVGTVGGLRGLQGGMTGRKADVDATFLTSDTSFVNDPPASASVGGRYATPSSGGASVRGSAARGATRGRGVPVRGGTGGSRGPPGARGSGIGRGRVRGVR
ncbi:DASH complex subunit DAM1-like protein [Elsinoe fawcettii]|nr:DASH complex subunit DAM1-like protein [Elsinoe fawcettii]